MITVKLEGLTDALNMCDPKAARLAARAAMERVINSGKSTAVDKVTDVYNVKKADLNGETKTGGTRIQVTTPRMDDLRAEIAFRSKRGMSLSYFGAKQISGSRVMSRKQKDLTTKRLGRKAQSAGPVFQGVLVQVLKGKETALLRNAFLAKMANGHIGVYRRLSGKMMKSKNKQAIAEKSVITIASMVANEKVMPQILEKIQERWHVEFPRQLKYYQGRAKR